MTTPLLAQAIWRRLSSLDRTSLGAIDVVDHLASTQDYLVNQPAPLRREWRLCVAGHQYSGHGRQGRAWQSGKGQVAFSWRGWIRLDPDQVGLLSLNAALAVQSALIALGVTQVQLKWPNDIYVDGRKLAGLLITIGQRKDRQLDVTLGIGLNRLALPLPPEAIAVQCLVQPTPEVADLIAAITHYWLESLGLLSSSAGAQVIKNRWLESAIWLGQPVTVLMGSERIDGIWLDITDQGALRVATEMGEKIYMANEVQLRSLG